MAIDRKKESALGAAAAGLAEWMFAMLPLLVVAIVTAHVGSFHQFLSSVEWSFGAAVLSAQALVRFVQGALVAGNVSNQRVVLVMAIVLVVVVVPTNIVLALALSGELRGLHPGFGLAASQIACFCVASVLFILVAAISHLWQQEARLG